MLIIVAKEQKKFPFTPLELIVLVTVGHFAFCSFGKTPRQTTTHLHSCCCAIRHSVEKTRSCLGLTSNSLFKGLLLDTFQLHVQVQMWVKRMRLTWWALQTHASYEASSHSMNHCSNYNSITTAHNEFERGPSETHPCLQGEQVITSQPVGRFTGSCQNLTLCVKEESETHRQHCFCYASRQCCGCVKHRAVDRIRTTTQSVHL